ncbi:MAG: CbiX/SirB N-terminal domain-containing protein [Polaromonas sp.]|nr:CbiX/SirB N-terminal domain-containing protein [Polaromonas sp.]
MNRHGIILFAHGSRDPLWHLPIEAVAAAIRARDGDALVGCAYLELSTPDLAQCAMDLIAAGARRLRVFPLFLGVGKHAREDLPQLVAQLRAAHPDVPVELMAAAGEDPRLTSLMAEIALS